MKISFLLPHLEQYGGIRRIIELSNVLVQQGHQIRIYHSDGSPCSWMKLRAEVFPLEQVFIDKHNFFVYIFHDQYDLACRISAAKKNFYCLNLYNKKVLALPEIVLKFGSLRSHQARKALRIKKALIDKSFQILVNCSDSAEWIHRKLGRDAPIVFGGVNQEIFHPIKDESKSSVTVLSLGSDKPWKGQSVLEKAIELVKKQYPDARLDYFYGKGIEQSKMAEIYSSADIFADAQYYAGWNNPVAEAMACKVPVVCGDIGPNRDIAIDGKTALLVEVREPKAYANAIIRLFKDRELGRNLSKNAFDLISNFTWQRAAQDLISALESHA